MAGLPVPGDEHTVGGLPIRRGTESDTITSDDLRDRAGALKRQAARFRIYAYSTQAAREYPCGEGTEITVGSEINGKRVKDVIWTVHVANKKANSYFLNDELGIHVYEAAHASERGIRNAAEGPDLANMARLRKLVIDPGPRTIRAKDTSTVHFDKPTIASYCSGANTIREQRGYPKSFPDDNFAKLYTPVGKIETLGELETDDQGRLIVLGGFGKACAWMQADGKPYPLVGGLIAPGIYGDVNADGWFDDTSDGPVCASIVFDDGTAQEAHGAWVVSTDPSYAPQTLNVVSLWDDIYDTWVRKLKLRPDIFRSRFQTGYQPHFEEDICPVFRAASLQRWTTNLPKRAIDAHDAVGRIKSNDAPSATIMTGLAFIRDPNKPDQTDVGAPFMPLSMGDAGYAFLTVTRTQYFFLTQWNAGNFTSDPAPKLGDGERLDKAVLVNCLGGRFAPGIEMTFIIRDPELYQMDWRDSGAGPFRIRAQKMDYERAQPSQPYLGVGYFPLQPGPDGIRPAALEPGDVSKFMAVPWHTDYNSCATHTQTPNPRLSSTLYWSWPAQRPVAVHVAKQTHDGRLGAQRYSVRGKGTASDDPGQQGRFQELIDSVLHWDGIGFVIQGSAIDGDTSYSPNQFLEVGSQLDELEVHPWPTNATELGT